jgi:hypothetical protein
MIIEIAADSAITAFVRQAPNVPALEENEGGFMYFVAAVLLVLSGLFYAAGNHEIGSFGVTMCRYGSTFCDSPAYVLAGAGLAAVWGMFVSIR